MDAAESIKQRLEKLREERIAREKARIEKLRELNRKKYNKTETQTQRSVSTSCLSRNKTDVANPSKPNVNGALKNYKHMNGSFKRPTTGPTEAKKLPSNNNTNINGAKDVVSNITDRKGIIQNKTSNYVNKTKEVCHKDMKKKDAMDHDVKPTSSKVESKPSEKMPIAKTIPKVESKPSEKMPIAKTIPKVAKVNYVTANMAMLRKSIAPKVAVIKPSSRKSMPASSFKSDPDKESVFDRLYKPKAVPKKEVDSVKKLHTDTNYLNQLIKDSGLILNKRHTVFDVKPDKKAPVRRSISAIHLKRISKNEMGNCIHKWSSIGEKLDKVHLKEIDEDANVKGDKVISAVKSERKKVKFQTPMSLSLNTPRLEDLESWLQKRGKSLESYHHLQCFCINHLSQRSLRPIETPKLDFEPKLDFDDENKENIALESDSDDGSYHETMNEVEGLDKWRHASIVSDSVDDSDTTTASSVKIRVHHVKELLEGALYDLRELLREGFDWEQCARWLRALRDRFPSAPGTPHYWECRAALEEARGDLAASVQCWEEAIAKGTERSVAGANLEQLLEKFMQLKISPNSEKGRQANPKLVDVKNVFKSTIIRFAVQKAKLHKSMQNETPKYTVTPVRRSARLSAHCSGTRTPLQICSSVKQASEIAKPLLFVPNAQIRATP